jgi:hypothetical protein
MVENMRSSCCLTYDAVRVNVGRPDTTDRPTEGISIMFQALFALLFGQFAGGFTNAVSWEK